MTLEIDYYNMLEMDARTASRLSVTRIREVIRIQKKQWTLQATNPLYQQAARSKLDQVRRFEKLLDDPTSLKIYTKRIILQQREEHKRHKQIIGRLIRIALAGRKSVTPQQKSLLIKQAAAQSISESFVSEMLQRMHVDVTTSLPAVQSKPELPYKSPALDRTILDQINRWLLILDKNSVYELLDISSKSSVQAIRQTAQFQFDKWSKVLPKSTECIAWEKSLQSCLTYIKDDDSKSKYDAALYNQRIDGYVQQVDLVLAGGELQKETQVELTRIGMREWGLSTDVIQCCIRARAVENSLAIAKPVSVSVQLHGQCQCMRCFAWNPYQHESCWNCGSTLIEKCRNPLCRRRLPGSAKVCPSCSLSVAHGRHFAELLHMADDALATGNTRSALKICRFANQLLPSKGVEQRKKRAGKIRACIVSAQNHFAGKALSATHASLLKLTQLAPECVPGNLPTIDKLSDVMKSFREKLKSVQTGTDVLTAADISLSILSHWSDSQEAMHILWRCCDLLAANGKLEEALKFAKPVRALRYGDQLIAKSVSRWEAQLQEARQSENHHLQSSNNFSRKLAEQEEKVDPSVARTIICDVKNLKVAFDGRNIRLEWKWPKYCQKAVVYRRFGKPPASEPGQHDRCWKISRGSSSLGKTIDVIEKATCREAFYGIFSEFVGSRLKSKGVFTSVSLESDPYENRDHMEDLNSQFHANKSNNNDHLNLVTAGVYEEIAAGGNKP